MKPRSRRRLLLPLAALLLALPTATPARSDTTPAGRPAAGGGRYTVTLLTGDRVDVVKRGDRLVPQAHPGNGRGHVRFAVTRTDGHVYVVPTDALRLVASGQLDRRLFDVAALIRYGYHDAKRADLPLLVQGGSADAVAPLADDGGGTVTRKLRVADAVAVRQPKRSASTFWRATTTGKGLRNGAKRVWLDGKRELLLDHSVPQIGAPGAWEAGYTGEGVKVAVLDSGIDASHQDFAGRLGDAKDFTGSGTVNDAVGHGTHVASTIAGTGAASGGKYKGVAPDATLLIGKVCGAFFCQESAILAGMQWAAESGATVTNMSLGGGDTPEIDPLERAVNDLTERYGTLFVVSAGNAGGNETVGSPGSADAALTVSAVDSDDNLAKFSSRGPRVGDAGLKPEITAPGVGIVAARAKDGRVGQPGEAYTAMSGTSMASPHVAGAAALIAQKHGDWKADRLKAALVGSAERNPELGAYAQGAGRVDVARAIGHDGYATPAVFSAGLASWPHQDDEPVTKTVTYHNPGSEQVTYQLATTTRGPDGGSAPDGMITVSADTVTVPAGGTASVEVTVDTTGDGPDGYHSAWVTATAGDARIVTPVAVNKEVESYDLTINAKGADGSVPEDYHVNLISLEDNRKWMLYDPEGSSTVRVPKGRYHVMAFIDGEESTSLLTQPVYQVTSDSTLTIDAGVAKPVSVTLDDPEARIGLGAVSYSHRWDGGGFGGEVLADDLAMVGTAHLGPAVAKDDMFSEVSSLWAVPDEEGDVSRSPKAYHLTYYEHGHLATGFTKRVRTQDLAAVKATYHASGKDVRGGKEWTASPPGWERSAGFAIISPLPMTRTEYHNVGGVNWTTNLRLETGDHEFVGQLLGGPVNHEARRTYRETWNAAAFGPGFSVASGGVVRDGDALKVRVPVYTDGAGHAGFSATESASTVLYRDGEKVGESENAGRGDFTVPAGAGDYRLTVDATRTVSEFSTTVSCEWTFRSGHTDELTVLPLATVGFAPKVDNENRAEAGRTQRVPVTVRTAAGAEKVKLRSLTVDVSYDDGDTWEKVRVTRGPRGTWSAYVPQPDSASYVSLRTRGVDTDGNSVKHTIIRAYGLK